MRNEQAQMLADLRVTLAVAHGELADGDWWQLLDNLPGEDPSETRLRDILADRYIEVISKRRKED